jgi:hypothetical protein
MTPLNSQKPNLTPAPHAENVAVHIALMPFSSFRGIIPAVFSDSAMRQLSNQ